jgi:hypothetical protein
VSNLDDQLKASMEINGALGAALVDYNSGMTLGTAGGGPHLDLEVAAASSTEVVRAQLAMMGRVNLSERIEDILITTESQLHLIRLLSSESGDGLFIFLALDKPRANMALARRELTAVERGLSV